MSEKMKRKSKRIEQKKENVKKERHDTKNSDYTPYKRKQLGYKQNGRQVYVAMYKAKRIYHFDEIKRHVRALKEKIMETGTVQRIGIGYKLSSNQHFGGSMQNIEDALEFTDYRYKYNDYSDIVEFYIYLN